MSRKKIGVIKNGFYSLKSGPYSTMPKLRVIKLIHFLTPFLKKHAFLQAIAPFLSFHFVLLRAKKKDLRYKDFLEIILWSCGSFIFKELYEREGGMLGQVPHVR